MCTGVSLPDVNLTGATADCVVHSQALESFLQRAPHDARGHVDTVLTCALKCLKYDPNFADDEDGGC
jgi:hypothetical protein